MRIFTVTNLILIAPFAYFQEEVAVKTVRVDIATPNKEEFFREADVMMKLSHECIVKLIGVCTEGDLLMVSFRLIMSTGT